MMSMSRPLKKLIKLNSRKVHSRQLKVTLISGKLHLMMLNYQMVLIPNVELKAQSLVADRSKGLP